MFITKLGVVAEDKISSSPIIKVYIKEFFPYDDGELLSAEKATQITLKSTSGGEISTSITMSNTIEATYMGSSNRQLPPDVVKGETVLLYNIPNTDTYYWESLGRNDNLRKTERLRYFVSANNVTHMTDADSTYYIDMDSKYSKTIKIKTSNQNDEKYAYTILLDGKNNKLHIHDDAGNEFCIATERSSSQVTEMFDSPNFDSSVLQSEGSSEKLERKDEYDYNKNIRKVRDNNKTIYPNVSMRTKYGAEVVCAKEDVYINGRDIYITADRQIVIDAPLETTKNTISVLESTVSLNKVSDTAITQSPCVGMFGAVIIPNTLVSGQITASGYSTGSVTNVLKNQVLLSNVLPRSAMPSAIGYMPSSIDIRNGLGKLIKNTPITSGYNIGNRHCAAWEQVNAALQTIADRLDEIRSSGVSVGETDSIRRNGEASYMPKNTGE